MKKTTKILSLIGLFSALSLSNALANNEYKFEKNHTSVMWVANHFGYSSVSGKFTDIDGSITFDESAPQNSKVEATIKIKSLATGLPKFNDHLFSKDFFNLDKFAEAKFVSKKVQKIKNKTAEIVGDLTLLGITKEVILTATFNKSAPNPMSQKPTIGFSAKATINRSDFGMNYALPNIADKVDLVIEVEANQ
jgi:polyisoprenoid-binding protein YceI